jgi:2-succinyl-6-hydroxy-2,4-cyclohexadiene-1-carboxylate synthase
MASALVLLHGFTLTGASWDPVRSELGERYRALAPDIRGHGSASERRPVSLEAVLDDIEALVEEPFALAGYSMGGRVALHYAIARPARVERLILIGASPGIADPAEREVRRRDDERLAEQIEHASIEQFAERWSQVPVLAGQPAAVRIAARADRLRSTPSGLAAALRGLGAGALPPLWDRLPELSMPTVLVAGERDQKFRAIAEQMAGAIPVATIEIVPGAGHAAQFEDPATVAAIIARASRA